MSRSGAKWLTAIGVGGSVMAQSFDLLHEGFLPAILPMQTSSIACDLDGDHDVDLVRVGQWPFLSQLQVLVNDGEGKFTPMALPFAPGYDTPIAVAAEDLDGDGDLDLLISRTRDPNGAQDSVLRNDGGLVFTDVTGQWWASNPFDATHTFALADLDGDGRLDVVCCNFNSNASCGPACSHPSRLFINIGGGQLALGATFVQPPSLAYHQSVAVLDYDGDGRPDVLFGGAVPYLFRNLGSRQFATVPIVLGSALFWVRAADLDGDGDDDLIGATTRSGPFVILRNDGGGVFSTVPVPNGMPTAHGVTIGDLDGDGAPDLLIGDLTQPGRGRTQLLRNLGGLVFADVTATWLEAENVGCEQPLLFDADGDGDLDLCHVHYIADRLLWNDGAGRLARLEPWDPFDRTDARATGWADLDGDATIDLIGVDRRNDLFVWCRNDGFGGFGPSKVLAPANWSCDLSDPVPFDLEGDGDLDLYLAGCGQDQVLENDGTGSFTDVTLAVLPFDNRPSSGVVVADFDGDGTDDLFVCRGNFYGPTATQDTMWIHHSGGFVDEGPSRLVDGVADTQAAAADLDGDGDLDLVLVGSGQARLYANDGTGTFTDVTAARLPPAFGEHALWTDLDGDGDPDLVLAGRYTAPFLLRNNAGAFTYVTGGLPAVANSSWPRAVDYDGDGRPDLVLGGHLLHNSGGLAFLDTGELVPTDFDQPSRRGVGDMDGDGDEDIASIGVRRSLRRQLSQVLAPRVGMHGELRLDARTDVAGFTPLCSLMIAAAPAAPPVALGSLGTLRIDMVSAFVHSTRQVAGTGTVRYSVPNSTGMLGVSIYAQAICCHDPSPSTWRLTNAVRLMVRR
ncbi:MAG: VCBS repeat-containing protein [Planctomycetota bacterium]